VTGPTTEWTGSVDFTSWFPFGYDACRFASRFEKVTVDVTLTADNKVASATVTGTNVEKWLATCTAADPKPMPHDPKAQSYSFGGDAAAKVVAKPAAGQDPSADLTIEGGVDADSKGWVSLTWTRTGVAAPYDWTIGPQYVSLTKK
jgi:hypothetical protein